MLTLPSWYKKYAFESRLIAFYNNLETLFLKGITVIPLKRFYKHHFYCACPFVSFNSIKSMHTILKNEIVKR